MKSFLFMIMWLTAAGTTQAAPSHATASLGLSSSLSQNSVPQAMGGQAITVSLNTQPSVDGSSRSALPLSAATQESSSFEAAETDLEAGLVLALAGVLAMVVVGRRRYQR